jgi:hypothetical protein
LDIIRDYSQIKYNVVDARIPNCITGIDPKSSQSFLLVEIVTENYYTSFNSLVDLYTSRRQKQKDIANLTLEIGKLNSQISKLKYHISIRIKGIDFSIKYH